MIGDLGSAIQRLYNSKYIILLLLWSYLADQHETKRGRVIHQNILPYWQIHVAGRKNKFLESWNIHPGQHPVKPPEFFEGV